MGWQFVLLVVLRCLVFLVTCLALACHIANIVLLVNYTKVISIAPWSTNIPYILYLVALGVSFFSSLALLYLTAARKKTIMGDKVLGIVNTIIVAAILIYNTIKSGPEPWLDNTLTFASATHPGWIPYCSAFNGGVKMGSNLFMRCWLINGLWLGMIICCVFWVALGIFAWTQHTYDVYDDNDDYHYKSDVPLVPVPSSQQSYSHAYSNEDPYDRSLTTSPAAKAAATYGGYNDSTSYEGYNNSAKPTYSDYNNSAKPTYSEYNTPTSGRAYGAYDTRPSERSEGYYDNYIPYRSQDNNTPGAQTTQSSKFENEDISVYGTPRSNPASPGLYSNHNNMRYGGGSPGYGNAYGGTQSNAYDYQRNNSYAKSNAYEGR
ncbi:hypothetical protein NQZ79_g3126 [Umbelopsis isabellina]|nr:hypothetical protein NQZ79_g3126 [Umbelopsis isabellina]